MVKTLVYLETKDGKLKKSGWELLTIAREQGAAVVGAVLGPLAEGELARFSGWGLEKLAWAKQPLLSSGHPELSAAALAALVEEHRPERILLAASSLGKDLAPRLATMVRGGLAVDCLSVDLAQATARRPVYGGKAIATVKIHTVPAVFSVRPNVTVVKLPAAGGSPPPVAEYQGQLPATRMELVERKPGSGQRPDLVEAERVVSGGRAMKNAENFRLLEELADALGSGTAVGASRAAVDAGYAPESLQVGQTGKVVSPTLYVACGISGSLQHFAGMKTAKVIVAINKDPAAPIFTKADYGIVADLFETVPLLTKEIRELAAR